MDQVLRRAMDPENAAKIDALLAQLRELLGIDDEDEELAVDSEKPFKPTSIILDDPSGNSFFQFIGSASDPQWNMRAYNRTLDQNVTLGLVARPDDAPEQQHAGQTTVADDHKLKSAEEFEAKRALNLKDLDGIVPDEVFSFPSTCSSCGHELETLMKQVNIPYFQVSFSSPLQRSSS
jgi:zinc finger protein